MKLKSNYSIWPKIERLLCQKPKNIKNSKVTFWCFETDVSGGSLKNSKVSCVKAWS